MRSGSIIFDLPGPRVPPHEPYFGQSIGQKQHPSMSKHRLGIAFMCVIRGYLCLKRDQAVLIGT
jgi:hypothetical protein